MKLKTSILIFKSLNFTINENDKIVFWGKSGVGKSTLLQLLGRLILPTNGQILYYGITEDNISWSFQDPLLIDEFTTLENILVFSRKSETEIDHILQKLGILNLKDTEARLLSSGEKQRVSLARAIAREPKVLIIDEPTAMVDQVNKDFIFQLLSDYRSTMILATHDPTFRKLAGKHFEIKQKRIISLNF